MMDYVTKENIENYIHYFNHNGIQNSKPETYNLGRLLLMTLICAAVAWYSIASVCIPAIVISVASIIGLFFSILFFGKSDYRWYLYKASAVFCFVFSMIALFEVFIPNNMLFLMLICILGASAVPVSIKKTKVIIKNGCKGKRENNNGMLAKSGAMVGAVVGLALANAFSEPIQSLVMGSILVIATFVCIYYMVPFVMVYYYSYKLVLSEKPRKDSMTLWDQEHNDNIESGS